MDACPSENVLAELLEGAAPGAANGMEAHLAECESCRALLGRLASSQAATPSATETSHPAADGRFSAPTPELHALAPVDAERYQLRGELARGGMGTIIEAWDRRHARRVAIKLLLRRDAVSVERFLREVRLSTRLEHPSIVTVYDAGRWADGEPFLAMKLVAGRSLAAVLLEKRSLQQRLALLPNLIAVTEAIAYAHAQGVVHRDLKPANVLVGQFGETVVIDWGLAKELRETGEPRAGREAEPTAAAAEPELLTVTGRALGTPTYMPPEQARGAAVDERADVYALGALLYHSLAGVPPYQGTSAKEVIAEVIARAPPSIAAREPKLPRDLATIVDQAMARDPAARHPSARALADELRRFQAGQLVAVHRYTLRELASRFIARHRAAVAVGALASLLLLIGGVSSLAAIVRARHRAEGAQEAAEARALALLEDNGRQALFSGQPLQAAALLSEAYRRDQGPVVRLLLARAMAAVDPLERTFTVPRGALSVARFSPDGQRVLTAGDDATARIWDASSGALLLTLTGFTDVIWSAAFSPDGSVVAAGGRNESLRLWDARTGAPRASIHTGPVSSLAFSPDGTRVASSGGHGAAIWDVRTGAKLLSFEGDAEQTGVAFSPDGVRIVTTSSDHLARVWDVRTKALLLTLAGHVAGVWHASYSADGARIVTGSTDGRAIIWDARTGLPLLAFDGAGGSVRDAQLSADGARVATASMDGVARIWDARTGELLEPLEGHADALSGVDFDASGARLLTAGWDGTARLWRVGAKTGARTLASRVPALEGALLRPGGAQILLETSEGPAPIVDARTGATAFSLAAGKLESAAYSRDGARIITTHDDHTARVWDASSGRPLLVIPGGGELADAVFTHDGARIVTIGKASGARIWDARSGAAISTLSTVDHALECTDTAADGRILIGGGRSATVFDGASGRPLFTLVGHSNQVSDCAFSPDGRTIATASFDRTARTWDAATGRPLRSFVGHTDHLYAVAFSPDGALLATGSTDQKIRLWDASTGALLQVLEGHTDAVRSVAFADGGGTLLSASWDRTARLWTLPYETRSPDEISAIVAAHVPYRLEGGHLMPVSRR